MRLPYASKQLDTAYKAVAKVVSNTDYLDMTSEQFVKECMKASGGNVNPKIFNQMYLDLMKDAGLSAMHSPMKSQEDDNGDHSWEYYVDGKVVGEEDFTTAHTSYYTA